MLRTVLQPQGDERSATINSSTPMNNKTQGSKFVDSDKYVIVLPRYIRYEINIGKAFEYQ